MSIKIKEWINTWYVIYCDNCGEELVIALSEADARRNINGSDNNEYDNNYWLCRDCERTLPLPHGRSAADEPSQTVHG